MAVAFNTIKGVEAATYKEFYGKSCRTLLYYSIKTFCQAVSIRQFPSLLGTLLFLTLSCPYSFAQTQLWQSNSAGNDIHIYDIESKQLIKRLIVGPEPHGIVATQDAKTILVSIENKWKPHGELIWINPKTFAITHRLTIGKEPQALATTPDGNWIYVPCRDGYYWVIDGFKKQLVKKIYTGGRPHNTRASIDGRFMYLSPMGKHQVYIVDIEQDHKIITTLSFSNSVRPPALLNNQNYFFQHVDGLIGFEVAHIPSRSKVARIHHSKSLGFFTGINRLGWLDLDGFHRCHGLGIRPNQTEIWSSCGHHLFIHSLTNLPKETGPNKSLSLPETHHISLEDDGYWLTFSPDDRFAFVALRDAGEVIMIDTQGKLIITRLKAGVKPKRNLVLQL